MCRFIETIRIEHGRAHNLTRHEQRMEATCRHFGFQAPLAELNRICNHPTLPRRLSKLRIVYGPEGIVEKSYTPYSIRKVDTLGLVDGFDIDYSYKFLNRNCINQLKDGNSHFDEIIIVRHGLITDTSYTNLAFFDGRTWFTPRTPLLPGTMRARLLEEGRLTLCDIRPSGLNVFSHVTLINAMLNLGELQLPINRITNR